MKSKSFDLKRTPDQNDKHNKTYDFVGYYQSIETSKLNVSRRSDESIVKDNKRDSIILSETPKHDRSLKKKKKKNEPVDISLINIAARNVVPPTGRSSPVEERPHTSTPCSTSKGLSKAPKVKSIMKNCSVADDDTMEGSSLDASTFKSKKRNKSVSFMLDDQEEVAMKKTKPDESLIKDQIASAKKKAKSNKAEIKQLKKIKKQMLAEKENKATTNMATEQSDGQNDVDVVTKKLKAKSDKANGPSNGGTADSGDNQVEKEKKKKTKKLKKRKQTEESPEPTETESNNNVTNHKVKKLKKKRQARTVEIADTTETEGEPATKARKKDIKPEIVAEHLENLSIGDNPHTLTNLLDDMTVVDKEKRKKNKLRHKKEKKTPGVSTSSDTTDLEKIEEGKEKVKWKRRKWNKDKKGDAESKLATTVLVENLPLSIMMNYRTLLMEHFVKFGLISRIGVAEVYPIEEPKPVFTTTIHFCSEAAATKALEEDNTVFCDARIRVVRPLPPTQTTLVVRSYAPLTEHAVSSMFSAAGRVRSIRLMVKGRKAIATAFIEFDGPEAVERAIKMAEDARICGKKMHVSRYEQRGPRKERAATGADNSAHSDDGDNSDDSDR